MILLVDVGNTRIKWMLWSPDRATLRNNFVHKNADRVNLGDCLWGTLERPAKVVIANVAGVQMADVLSDWLVKTWSITPQFVSSQAEGFGIRNAYSMPGQLGVDRWVAMIGARTLTRQNCCIVDCGTAITVDALAFDGAHLGGVIFPGTRLMREALYRDTRQIMAEDKGQMVLFGKNTRDGVWSGTTYAVTAAIDGITGQMEEKMRGGIQRMLTGGNAQRLLPLLKHSYRLEADLIFRGLQVIAGYE